MAANEHIVSFGIGNNVLNIVVMAEQEYTKKDIDLCTLCCKWYVCGL